VKKLHYHYHHYFHILKYGISSCYCEMGKIKKGRKSSTKKSAPSKSGYRRRSA